MTPTALIDRVRAMIGARYAIERELGRGGMAVVFHATDRELRRDVAIKVLTPDLGGTAEQRARFVREARTAASLSHPNLVPIFDVGERDDVVWFVMGLIEGESLSAKVEREGALPLGVVRAVIADVAQGLAYAHARGVVHRDIKPDNILIERDTGRALVADFGIAKVRTDESDLTSSGAIVGTARYMSPEQATATGEVDGRTDVYALGLVAYFMLAGNHAIQAATLPAIIMAHAGGLKVRFDAAKRQIPVKLTAALQRCVEPAAPARYARMEELLTDLRELGSVLPDTPPAVRSLVRDVSRALVGTALLGVGALVADPGQIPPALLVLAFGGLGWTVVHALEQGARKGIGWPSLRRAMYVEAARRRDEQGAGEEIGPVATAAFLAVAMVAVALGVTIVRTDGGGQHITFGGVGGAATAVGMLIAAMKRRSARLPFGGDGAAFVAFLMGFAWIVLFAVYWSSSTFSPALLATISLVVSAAIASLVVAVSGRLYSMADARAKIGGEWRIPRWLDVLGSVSFGRFERDGWRITFHREEPATIADTIDIRRARRLSKRIARVQDIAIGTLHGVAAEAADVAASTVHDLQQAARRVTALAARIARLKDGVLASRTVAAGGTLDSELDAAERQLDSLRHRAQLNVRVLEQLATGLEALQRAPDEAAIKDVVEYTRKLSSAVDGS